MKCMYHGEQPRHLNQAERGFRATRFLSNCDNHWTQAAVPLTSTAVPGFVFPGTSAGSMQWVCQRAGACSSCLESRLKALLGFVKRQRRLPACVRAIYSETGKWEKSYGLETRRRVESWWLPRIKDQFCRISETDVSMTKALEIVLNFLFSWKEMNWDLVQLHYGDETEWHTGDNALSGRRRAGERGGVLVLTGMRSLSSQ